MTAVLVAVAATAIAAPHVLRLTRARPATAVAVWLSGLALRALAVALAVVYALFFLPATAAFSSLTHWCLHAVAPGLAAELRIEGHGLGDLLLLVPGVLLAGSLALGCLTTARAVRAARRAVDGHVVGTGPRNSLIVSGPEVLLAVDGIARPRIIVSAGALASLDDEELEAALDHEEAHIARRHRWVALAATILYALARPLPGTRRAERELAFHLERDADRWALGRRNDRIALASAICKAAMSTRATRTPAVAGLSATGVGERVCQLLDDPPVRRRGLGAAALNGIAAAMVACTLVLAAVVPTTAVAGARSDAHGSHHSAHCEH